ncbi:NRDE family protein [Halobacteria archaeon AArc-dxtr1]|nr:NRDE family protein [Halobacteria archaeon AArc-dxtr1]
MCTLVLAWQVFADAPVAVAANRDEAVGRPSTRPAVYREAPLVIAPRDTEAGGTWIGYNEHGVFAGITNRWTDADLGSERSRGLLVGDALAAPTAAVAADRIEAAVERDEYDGFSLVVADAETAVCYTWDGDLERIAFDPGVHVVVNVAVDDAVDVPRSRVEAARLQADSAGAIRAELEPEPVEDLTSWLDRARSVLGDHEYGACVHGDGFGTRSSSLLALGSEDRYLFADGAPCSTPYEPVSIDREGHI